MLRGCALKCDIVELGGEGMEERKEGSVPFNSHRKVGQAVPDATLNQEFVLVKVNFSSENENEMSQNSGSPNLVIPRMLSN